MNYFERFTKKKKLIFMSSYIILDLFLITLFLYKAPQHFKLFIIQMIIADVISIISFILFFQLKNIYLYIVAVLFSPLLRFCMQLSFVLFAKLIIITPKTIIEVYCIYFFIAISPLVYKFIAKSNDFKYYSKLVTKLIFLTLGIHAIYKAYTIFITKTNLNFIWNLRIIIILLIEIIIIISFVISIYKDFDNIIEKQKEIKRNGPKLPNLIKINQLPVEFHIELRYINENVKNNINFYLQTNGEFKTKEELMNIKGIGPKIFSDIKNKITLLEHYDESFITPTSATSLHIQAQKAYQSENFSHAQQLYQNILDTSPNDIPVLNNLGLCFKNLNQHQQAIQTYQAALALTDKTHPAQPALYKNLGVALYLNKHRRKAIHFLKKAKRISKKQNLPLPEIDNILRIVKLEIRDI